jgi:hypothetical protein
MPLESWRGGLHVWGVLKFFGDIKFWRVLICVGPSPCKPFFCQMFSACANKHPFV